MKREYTDHGWWKVTTEGDVEGKTTVDLGVHYGYLDEVAFALADKAYYGLQLEKADAVRPKPSGRTTVTVQLGCDSGTWDLTTTARRNYMATLLRDRPVAVEETPFYASVVLVNTSERAKKAAALAKLTDEDKRVLGLS